MISKHNFSPLIAEALEELQFNDMEGLCPAIQKLLNELMLIEREQAIKAAPYERSEQRQGYANGFKDKMLQSGEKRNIVTVKSSRSVRF